MSANANQQREHAIEFLRRRYRDSVELVPVDSLPTPVYAFDPAGWVLFAVIEMFPSRLGGTEYVAVSRSTAEVRYLGHVGE